MMHSQQGADRTEGLLTVTELFCEGEAEPVGLDAHRPVFGWKLESGARAQHQTAYQILVATSTEVLDRDTADLWDSGRVPSGESRFAPFLGDDLLPNSECLWKVRVWDADGVASDWSKTARFTSGMLERPDWSARWIQAPQTTINGEDPDGARRPTYHFRHTFRLTERPDFAQVTINSPCYFELWINGNRMGTDVLSPAVSDLDQLTFSLSYEVTDDLDAGPNCIGLWLGYGWSNVLAVRAQLTIRTATGVTTISTGEDWRASPTGRYRIGLNKWNDFGGELVDARESKTDWSHAEFDDSSWGRAMPRQAPTVAAVNQPCPRNRIGARIPAVDVTALSDGRYEVDFGTNLTGWLRFLLPALKPGQRVRMTFADSRNNRRDNAEYQHFNQVSEFISAGGPGEVFEHKFNYAGFRYVVVEGLDAAPEPRSLTALLVESDLPSAGEFSSSNELFNRIHRLNTWTQRCLNLGGYYVDCPHRERMGYGDGQVAVEGFMSHFQANRYYRKCIDDWRRAMRDDGSLPNSVPFYAGGGGPGWGGSLAAITWRHFLYYGDLSVLRENVDSVRRYVEYLERVSNANGGILTGETGPFSFIGDWIAPGRGMDTENAPSHEAREFFNNCYRLYQIELLGSMYDALGDHDRAHEYRELAARLGPRIHDSFYDPAQEQYVLDDQAYYVMPLMTGVTPPDLRARILERLETCIVDRKAGHLDTGMLGTYFLMEFLRQADRNDLVSLILSQTDYPGWGYMLEQGATTIWEQWNGYWSHIHSCFTSPGNWFYQALAGIQPDPAGPGFKRFIVRPAIVPEVHAVTAHHDSPFGRIRSDWSVASGRLRLAVGIPVNATATVYVPTTDPDSVTESGSRPGTGTVEVIGSTTRALAFRVPSGEYIFESIWTDTGSR